MADQSTTFPNVHSTSGPPYTFTYPHSVYDPWSYFLLTLRPFFVTSVPSILLSITTITLNIFVINYYRKGELSLVPFLYTMIASADILTAVGVIHQSVAFSLVTKGVIGKNSIDIHAVVFYTVIQISYRSSVFYNLVLAVSRTIMILRPFLRIKIGAVKLACILYVVPWLILAALDIHQFYFVQNQFAHSMYVNWILHMGASIANDHIFLVFIPQVIAFLIPVLIISITCIIQLVSLHRSSQFEASSNQRHVTITVILISTLFVVCNSAYYGYVFSAHLTSTHTPRESFVYVVAVLGTVLPILNSALNPVIIITRSNGLRVKFLETMRRIKSWVRWQR